MGYEHIFKTDPCVCDADRMGHDCSTVYDPAAIEEAELRAEKLINWTRFKKESGRTTRELFG